MKSQAAERFRKSSLTWTTEHEVHCRVGRRGGKCPDPTLKNHVSPPVIRHRPQFDVTPLRSLLGQAATLFTFALLIRALHFLAMRESPLFQVLICDCGQYDNWAQRIAGGEWIGREVFYQTPLYPYLLAVVYGVVGHSVWAVRCLQAVFGALACVALARAGANFFSERVGWTAGILLAIYPPAVFFDGILQKASLDLLLMATLLWVVGAAQREPRWACFAAAGVLLGAMTLNRENSAALLPVLLAWIVWIGWRSGAAGSSLRGALSRAALFLVGLAAVLLPVGLRNYHVGGAFLLTTAQMGPNFYIGNHHGANGGYVPLRAGRGEPEFESLDARLIAEDDLKRPLSSHEVSRYWMARSWDDIRGAPAEWMRLLAWKWLLTWHAIEFIDAEAISAHARSSPILSLLGHAWHFGVLCPLALVGMWFTRRDARRLWVLYAMLLAFAGAVTLFYVFARYRYPLVPVAMLFAAAGMATLVERLRRRAAGDAREMAIGLALGGAAAVACNWPIPQRFDDVAVTYYNAGSTMMALGRTDDAIALLHQAREIDPRFPDTYNNLGRALFDRGDFAAAQRYFEEAIAVDGNQAIFHVNLANTLIKRHERERAIGALRRAIELDPLMAPAYVPLAELEFQQGDVETAVRHLRRGVELQPDMAAGHADLATVLAAQGKTAEAIAELRIAVALDGDLVPAANRLAWLLATAHEDDLRSGREAVALAEQLCRATEYRHPQLLDTLAAAYAETGQYERAAETAERAVARARDGENDALVPALEARRQLYLSGKPFRGGK